MSLEPRLAASIWVAAYIRRCQTAMVPAVVVRHGDDTSGALLIKLNTLGAGCVVYQPTTTLKGGRAWLQVTGPAPVSEEDADAFIGRALNFDPDLWVVEVEDPEGRHFLDGDVIDS